MKIKINKKTKKFLKIVELYGWKSNYFIQCLVDEYGEEQLQLWIEAYKEQKGDKDENN